MKRQTIILAGGLGTRMHPHTLRVPKSLLEVAGRPFVDWQLDKIAGCGFDRVVLCVGHLGEQIEAHVGDGARHGLRVDYSYDGPRLLGTAGAVRRALETTPDLDEEFLVTWGDSYLPFDYGGPLSDLRAHPRAAATMSVFRNEGQWDSSNVAVEGERVARYEKGSTDPALDHIDYGATAVRREILAGLDPDAPADLADLFQRLAAEGRLRAYVAGERFYEIGSESGLRDLAARLGA